MLKDSFTFRKKKNAGPSAGNTLRGRYGGPPEVPGGVLQHASGACCAGLRCAAHITRIGLKRALMYIPGTIRRNLKSSALEPLDCVRCHPTAQLRLFTYRVGCRVPNFDVILLVYTRYSAVTEQWMMLMMELHSYACDIYQLAPISSRS